MGLIKDTVCFVHNMFQFITWGLTLYLIHSYMTTGSPPCWREVLTIAQYEQSFDIVLSALKMIPNNPVTVTKQVLSRLMVIGLIMPKLWYDPALEPYVLMAAIPWCIAECVRYPFYQFKGL